MFHEVADVSRGEMEADLNTRNLRVRITQRVNEWRLFHG